MDIQLISSIFALNFGFSSVTLMKGIQGMLLENLF